MSLWLALIWFVCMAICLSIFAFCRKRLADITQQVAEEIENQVNRILKAEREAEAKVLDAFSNFENPADAIQTYQKTESEIFRSPRARPLWNWSIEDLELWQKMSVDREKTHRGRPVVLAAVIIILSVNIASAVITVITLNSVQPVLAAQATPINTAGISSGYLPTPVGFPATGQSPISLPSLPTTFSLAPVDNTTNAAKSLDDDTNTVSDVNAAKHSGSKGGK